MRNLRPLVLLLPLLLPSPCRATHREAGNDFYKVSITTVHAQSTGFYTTYAGPSHPVTSVLGRTAFVLPFVPDCLTCGGETNTIFFAVRSWTSHRDYTLGVSPLAGLFTSRDPGFECVDANDISTPLIEDVFDGPDAVGMKATWDIDDGEDHLHVEELVRVHGHDWIGSATEVSLTVENTGSSEALLGFRTVWDLLIDLPWDHMGPPPTAASMYMALRPPDPPAEPFVDVETDWHHPAFRMWQTHLRATSAGDPSVYFIAAAVNGPMATLDPPPTPPDVVQYSETWAGTPLAAGGGAQQRCFDWQIPDPPRTHDFLHKAGVTTYWGGPAEVDAIRLVPGEQTRATQYLVAFTEYPLSVETSGPFETECSGPATDVAIEGRALLTDTTSAPIVYRWSSPSPQVTLVDASAPSTTARVDGLGTFPVTLTVDVGAYEASADTTVTVTDDSPPTLHLAVTPDSLWPPNHRLVNVHVNATAWDDCDPAPSVRLVGAFVDELPLEPGSGHAEPDIVGAEIGTADFDVQLRAERSGRLDGRTYRLVYEATDWAGNTTTQSALVQVGHDQGRATRPRPPRR